MSHETGLVDAALGGALLSPSEWERLRTHLRGCEACRTRFDDGMRVLRAARGGPTAWAPGELARLTANAVSLAQPRPAPVAWPWRRALLISAAAAAVALVVASAWPRAEIGRVLVASAGLTVDGVKAEKGTVLLAGSVVTTAKEDAAVLLVGARGRRGLLLRPSTSVRLDSSDRLTVSLGRVRVELREGNGAVQVAVPGGEVTAQGSVFVVERRDADTLVAVHQGSAEVRGSTLVLLAPGQETALTASGEVAPIRPAAPRSLIEDRGDGSLWDAILRLFRTLLSAISKALSE